MKRQFVGPLLLTLVLLMLISALGGCSTLLAGDPRPIDPRANTERISLAYMANAQVRETTAILLKQKKIASWEARRIQTLADMARLGIDQARDLFLAGQNREAALRLDKVDGVHIDIQSAHRAADNPPK